MSLQIVIPVGTFLLRSSTRPLEWTVPREFLTQTHWDTMVTTGTEITVQEHLRSG